VRSLSASNGGRRAPLSGWLVRWSPWFWTVAIVIVCDALFKLEWSYPMCNDPTDGPAFAVFGFPLPSQRFAGNSLEYATMPHVYALDLVLIALVVFPPVRWLLRRLARLRVVAAAVAGCGLAIASLSVAFLALVMYVTWVPVRSISGDFFEDYRDLRPAGLGHLHIRCSPSEYWFGPARRGVEPG